jgi:DNA replication protein DnaC
MSDLKQINQDELRGKRVFTRPIDTQPVHARHCKDEDCVLCQFAHPEANPHCHVCKGFGFVHPYVKSVPTPEGDMVIGNYSRVIPCPAEGCLKDTITHNTSGTYDNYRGLSRLQTLNNFNQTKGSEESWKACNLLLNDPPDKPLLYIYGDMGAGKTHLANGTALALAQQGKNAKLWIMTELLDWLREGVGNDSLFARTTELKELDALVIDDFESAKLIADKGQWALEKMEEVIDHRYHSQKITMITSNDNYDKLPEKILDRFKDKSVAQMIYNEAGNYRGKKHK